MTPQIVLPCVLLLLGCGLYVFWPQRLNLSQARREKSRVDYLAERREVVFDNLRDLNFEYRSGKFPEEDYLQQRASLEAEAAHILAEMDLLSGQTP